PLPLVSILFPYTTLFRSSHGKRVSLEETIHKIIQIEFVNYLPYIIQQAKKCEPVSAQDSDEKDILDGPIEIDFVQKKEPPTSIADRKSTRLNSSHLGISY